MCFETKHWANLKEVTEIFTSFYFEEKKLHTFATNLLCVIKSIIFPAKLQVQVSFPSWELNKRAKGSVLSHILILWQWC